MPVKAPGGGWAAERTRQGKDARTAALHRGRCQDCAVSRTGRLVAQDRTSNGMFGQDVPQGGAKVRFSGFSPRCQSREGQKPFLAVGRNRLKSQGEQSSFGVGQNQVFQDSTRIGGQLPRSTHCVPLHTPHDGKFAPSSMFVAEMLPLM